MDFLEHLERALQFSNGSRGPAHRIQSHWLQLALDPGAMLGTMRRQLDAAGAQLALGIGELSGGGSLLAVLGAADVVHRMRRANPLASLGVSVAELVELVFQNLMLARSTDRLSDLQRCRAGRDV